MTVQELLCYALDLNPGPACGSKAFCFDLGRLVLTIHHGLASGETLLCSSLPEDSNDSDSLMARESSAVWCHACTAYRWISLDPER